MLKRLLNIWKYSLGSFSDDKTGPYDNYIAVIRTCIFTSYLVTNCFIVSGVIRHWNYESRIDSSNRSTQASTTQCDR
ncbi:MAG: hypothetical protein CBC89_06340 [Euryarchaeota archaeon TMED129]|nr:MAG: hypothetical protein CBC89_06340 [Euryarchaeota archaeon TMED129]